MADDKRDWLIRCRVVFASGDKFAACRMGHSPYGRPVRSEAEALQRSREFITARMKMQFSEPFTTANWTAERVT